MSLEPQKPKHAARPLGKEAGAVEVRTAGRPPSVYRPELAADICERIASGETLRAICTEDGMPRETVFRRWVLKYEDLRTVYRAAREIKADSLFDEGLDLARAIMSEPGSAQRVRAYDIAINQLRWAAGKLNPQQYSEKSSVSFTVPIQINTPLDLGQGGVDAETADNVYQIEATVEQETADGATPDKTTKGAGPASK